MDDAVAIGGYGSGLLHHVHLFISFARSCSSLGQRMVATCDAQRKARRLFLLCADFVSRHCVAEDLDRRLRADAHEAIVLCIAICRLGRIRAGDDLDQRVADCQKVALSERAAHHARPRSIIHYRRRGDYSGAGFGIRKRHLAPTVCPHHR